MPIHHLSSIDDPRLNAYRDLQQRSIAPAQTEDFVVEGKFCVKMLADSPLETTSVVVQEGRERAVANWFPETTDIFVIDRDQVESLVGFAFHRGMLACGRRPTFKTLQQLPNDAKIVLATVGIGDRDNLGNMLRTAAGFGIDHIIVDRSTVDPFSRRVVRVSMATVLRQRIFESRNLVSDLRWLADERGYRTLATTLDRSATPIREFKLDDRPIVLMMGNEGTGLDPSLIATSTDPITIPMADGVDSLNVSLAAAIFMYELCS